jgi:predicted pyridoxine 5'-phosphate oxidase superfamily flavin-nucleotide-binding protein
VPYDPVTEAAMTSMLYHQGNRAFQDEFGSRRLADRLEERSRTAFTDDDKVFIESCIYFFMATADASGRPDCSFKGGAPGFARVTGPSELAFPDYDGNARIDRDDPLLPDTVGAQLIVRIEVDVIFPNCPRYIPSMTLTEPSIYVPHAGVAPVEPAWKGFDAFRDVVPPRAGLQSS